MLVSEAREELRDLLGIRLPSPEMELRYINRAHAKLCTRSEWTQANVSVGNTVAGDPDTALPSNVHRILSVNVDGVPYEPSDVVTVSLLRKGELRLSGAGVYWLSFAADGDEALALYPTPGTSGLAIRAQAVVYPPELEEENDAFRVPIDFDQYVIDGVAALYYDYREDNPELRATHEESFDRGVSELRRLRTSRAGRGPVQMRVVGVHV